MITTPRPLPAEDLTHVLTLARPAFEALRGARLFITGGTGFFGHWLVESLLHANRTLDFNASVLLLTRDTKRFRESSPHIAHDPAVFLVEGSTNDFSFHAERCTHIVHAATDSTGAQANLPEAQLAASIVQGTRHVLEFAAHTDARRMLYVSSGAVYGRGITTVDRIAESHPLPPLVSPPRNYEQAKRLSTDLCFAAGHRLGMAVSVAQCFAFVGPRLPLDAHFAIGNFIADAMANRPIHITGDGTPRRSFLYMSDLAAWLWTMLATAPAQSAYNVGSDEAVSIAQLAQMVVDTLRPGLTVQIDGTPDPSLPPSTYVPAIVHAERELGLRVTVPLAEAIRRTAAWHGYSGHIGCIR